MLSKCYKKTNKVLILIAAAAMTAVLCFPVGCRKNKINRGRANVIIITMDTTRADHIGAYGYNYIRTPNIDSLASEGVLFENAYSVVPLTLPSHTSIMTGLYPPAHGVRDNNRFSVPEEVTTLAELLKQKGYQTGAIIAAFVLDRAFGLSQGFDVYDDSGLNKSTENQIVPERKADVVTNHAIAWLKYNKGRQPFFLWVHYYDPHAVYAPPDPFSKEYSASPYDGEIAFVDQQISRLIGEARKSSGDMPLAIVLTADHGDSLGDHREMTHGLFVYNSTMHVPLILDAPKMLPAGIRIKSRVTNVSIAPTVLDLLGMQIPQWMQGKSLLTAITGEDKDEDREIYLESETPFYSYNWSDLRAVLFRDYYYIDAPKPELYDIRTDYEQLFNLADSQPETVERMAKRLAALEKEISKKNFQQSARSIRISAEAQQKLNALGYIEGQIGQSDTIDIESSRKKLPDPKDNVETHIQFMQVAMFVGKGEYEKALNVLDKLLIAQPDNPQLLLHYAKALRGLKRIGEARTILENLIALYPNSLGAIEDLAQIEFEEGNFKKAKKLLEYIDLKGPINQNVCRLMAKIYIKEGNTEKAKEYLYKAIGSSYKELETIRMLQNILVEEGKPDIIRNILENALKESPTDTEIMDDIAFFRQKVKDYEGAISMFRNVLELDPNDKKANFNFAVALLKHAAENPANAAAEMKEALDRLNKTLEIDPEFPNAKKYKDDVEKRLIDAGQLRR